MKNLNDILEKQINELLTLVNEVMASKKVTGVRLQTATVDRELFYQFKTASQSFILRIYGKDHPYFIEFNENVVRSSPFDAEVGRGILNSIKIEINNGWLNSIRDIVTAEIFTDMLEMSEHLLVEGYKDPAAVMIGSVLEQHLRYLSEKNDISVFNTKGEKEIPKKADLLNAELSKAFVYNKLDHKNITAWLELRNKAAHGHYDAYTLDQVKNLLLAISEFIGRTS